MNQPNSKLTFGDAVRVKKDAPAPLRRLQKASVIMVFHPQDRRGSYFDQFPPGTVYSIEYDDMDAAMDDIHEDFLEKEGG